MALTARFCPLPLTREASDWALRELLIRAGITAAATPDIRVRYGADEATTTDSAAAMVTIAPCSPSAWTVAVVSVIWHNDMFIRERRDWALVYRRLVERLSAIG